MTKRQIAVRVRRGQWQRVYPRVYAGTAGPLPDALRMRAALLYAGPTAVLSHLTAAAQHNLADGAGRVHVLIPHERRLTSQPGLVVHRTRVLPPTDVRRRDGMPVTSVDRTVVDCLLLLGPISEARALAAAAIQQRRTTADRLADAAGRLGAGRTAWVARLLDDLAGGSQSELELRFLALCREYGLPTPDRQQRVGRYHIDAAFGDVLVELDSRSFHVGAGDWERDVHRHNTLARGGRTVLRFTWRMVCDQPELVAATIRAALRGDSGTDTVPESPHHPLSRSRGPRADCRSRG